MIDRREFLKCSQSALLVTGVAMVAPRFAVAKSQPEALDIGLGPQLFLDDYVVESMEGLNRVVQSPERVSKPVLSSKKFGTTQPYMTVLQDPETKRYRIWYNNKNAVWHAESDDGVAWRNPKALCEAEHCFGASVVDDGPGATDVKRRFKLANWQATRIHEDKPGDDGGMWVAFSPDGNKWTNYEKNPVLPTWPEGHGKIVPHGTQDIIDVFYDPLQKQYIVAVKSPAIPADGYSQAPRAGQSIRRLVCMSKSADFVHWEKPWRIIEPNEKEEGLLEFYGMGGIHQRGKLYIGLARVLHDDFSCDPGGPKDGIGYAALVTSRDGRTWHRFREPFLDRNHEPGSWDHAMTWIGYSLPVGDEVFFYYGGYARGHKIESQKERQIGLARMKRDRYVSLDARGKEGKLVTRPFLSPGGRITINANAKDGEIRVRLLGADNQPIATAEGVTSIPIRGDVLAVDAGLQKSLEANRGKPVRLEFVVQNASLFGFDVHNDQA